MKDNRERPAPAGPLTCGKKIFIQRTPELRKIRFASPGNPHRITCTKCEPGASAWIGLIQAPARGKVYVREIYFLIL